MSDFIISYYPYLSCIFEVLIECYFFYRFLHRKVSPVSLLLYAVIIVEVMNLCYGIFHSISCIITPLIFQAGSKVSGMIFMTGSTILSLILAVFCYTRIEKHLKNTQNEIKPYLLMILAPVLLILFVSEYIAKKIYGNTVTINRTGEVILSASPYQILLIQCLGLASIFCILYSYKKICENFQLNKQVSLLEQETRSLNQYVAEAMTRVEKTKSFRHDIKNHITIIKELLLKNKPEAALQYMEDVEILASKLSFPVNTNNPVLDILLGNKLGLATSKQICVDCSLFLPNPVEISDIDFCIVLSNALDNAISACDRMENNTHKFIHINSKIQSSFLMIEISNSYSGKKTINKGTGMSNISAVTEKYQGAMDIKTGGNIFTLSVLFVIPQHPDDTSRQFG